MKGPFRWWRDRRDPTADLEPIAVWPDGDASDFDDEMDYSLRAFLEDIAAADARGGLPEVVAEIRRREVRERDAIRFKREGRQFWITAASLIVAIGSLLVAGLTLLKS